MTMLSFRVDDDAAAQAQGWADRLGVDRSELLRVALRRHLARLEADASETQWSQRPRGGGELSLADASDPGNPEAWSDWEGRFLDDETRSRLLVRAARRGRSPEAEARAILREELSRDALAAPGGLGSRIHALVAAFGGVELDLPSRDEMPTAPDLR